MTKLLKIFFSLNSISLTIFSTLFTAILFLTGVPILGFIELKAYDLRFRSRGPVEPSSAVVMAVIDEKSLDKVIGFDIGFLEPDENFRLKLINQLAGKITALRIPSIHIRQGKRSNFVQIY